MEIYKLPKPALEKIDTAKTFAKFISSSEKIDGNIVREASEPNYLFWDKFRFHPRPKGMSAEEAWVVVKEIRKISSRKLFIKAETGENFTFYHLQSSDELLHRIDIETGGTMFAAYETLSPRNKQKFFSRGIIEEAIASSQLEGANTTRKVAKKMLLEKRKPRNRSEQMILNNYNAMQKIEHNFKNEKMSSELLLELHKVLTEDDSAISEEERGRFRTDKDDIVVQNQEKQLIVHIPPKEKFLNKELVRFIEYANDEDSKAFIHPIVKAIFLHFWLGYLHPFTDGNGRIARAVFYWYLLRKNYWTMMFLPISTAIKKSRTQYDKAYIYSEQDDYDLTYFFDYHLKKIIHALDDFHEYVENKISENREMDVLVEQEAAFNERQKQVLHYLLSEGGKSSTTAEVHMSIFNISRLTAYKDLKTLEDAGYLFSKKIGRYRHYYLTDKLKS